LLFVNGFVEKIGILFPIFGTERCGISPTTFLRERRPFPSLKCEAQTTRSCIRAAQWAWRQARVPVRVEAHGDRLLVVKRQFAHGIDRAR